MYLDFPGALRNLRHLILQVAEVANKFQVKFVNKGMESGVENVTNEEVI